MKGFIRAGRWLSSSVRRSGEGASRFPVAVLAIVGFAVASHLAVAGLVGNDRLLVRVLAALSSAGASAVATTLFLEARGASAPLRVACSFLVSAAVAAAIGWSSPFAVYAPALLLACLLAAPLMPFLGRGTARNFWRFGFWTSAGVALSFVSVLVFSLGAQAILTMVRFLFDAALLPRLDRHLYTAALTLVGPLFALGRVPRVRFAGAEGPDDDRLIQLVRPLFEWVQAPLILAAALVLHLYAVKIVVTGDLPHGEIGWVVLTYTMLLVTQRLALEPLRERAAAPVRIVVRFWSLSALVPLALLALAVQQRVQSEGVTAERYYLALWGLSVGLVIVLQRLPGLRSDIRLLVGVPAALLVASTIGPWGVADTVGRSQASWIVAERPELETATAPLTLTSEDARRLRSRLGALEDVEELQRLRHRLAMVPPDDAIWLREPTARAVFDRIVVSAAAPPTESSRDPAGPEDADLIDLRGYDRAVWVSNSAEAGPAWVRLVDGAHLEIRLADRMDRLALPPMPSVGEADGSSFPARFDLVTEGGRHVRLHVRDATFGGANASPPPAVESLTALLLLRMSEWSR